MTSREFPAIKALMDSYLLPDLDRSVLTGRFLDLTRMISGHIMREPFAQHSFCGMRALSRHSGSNYVLFESRYALGTRMVGPIRLTPEDSDVIKAAARLRLVP